MKTAIEPPIGTDAWRYTELLQARNAFSMLSQQFAVWKFFAAGIFVALVGVIAYLSYALTAAGGRDVNLNISFNGAQAGWFKATLFVYFAFKFAWNLRDRNGPDWRGMVVDVLYGAGVVFLIH